MPSHLAIVLAHLNLLTELKIEHETAFRTCWFCRYEFTSGKPTRAHLKAHVHGGEETAQNMILLCDTCHSRQPDSALPSDQIEWLKASHQNKAVSSREQLSEGFKSATGHTIEELLSKMIDKWGEKGMLDHFRMALKTGDENKAGPRNGIPNAVYELVLIWESLD